MLLRLSKKENVLIITKKSFTKLTKLSTQNTIVSYRSRFMLFTGSTFLQLGMYVTTIESINAKTAHVRSYQ